MTSRNGTIRNAKAQIDGADVVLAVFPDCTRKDGQGLLIIKGQGLLELGVALQKTWPNVRVVWLPCDSLAEAQRIQAAIGDRGAP